MPNPAVLSSKTMTFADLRKGMRARVVAFDTNPELARLEEMGLTVGTEFTVAKVAPFGDTLEIRLRGYSLCLRQREAVGITVELCEP
jgi:Fe2+ transport system protein FeoA